MKTSSYTPSPFFSICIPAYNCGRIILEAFESVARQSCNDWELIVYDDGSSDDTPVICHQQQIIPPDRYNFYRGAHEGPLETRQRAWALARGRVIITLDADDFLIGVDALQKIFDVVHSTGCDIVMFNATRDLSSMKRFVDYENIRYKNDGLLDSNCVKRAFCMSYQLNNIAFKAFNRELASCVPEERHLLMAEDRLQSAYLLDAAKGIALLDEVLYYYRINEVSTTTRAFEPEFFNDQMKVEIRVNDFARQWELDEVLRDRLYASVLVGDLLRIREDYSSFTARKSAYQQIRKSNHFNDCISSIFVNSPRFDHRLIINTHLDERYHLLDWLLKLKAIVRVFLQL